MEKNQPVTQMMIKNICFSFLILLLNIGHGNCQLPNADEALKLKASGKQDEALLMFRSLLQKDSSNVLLLWNTSSLMSVRGIHLPSEAQQTAQYKQAEYLSRKAIKIDNTSAESHYALALALGRLSENAGTKTQIHNAKEIRTECEKAIQLNPNLAGPYHILGRWHRVVAGFNSFEKAMIATFFGNGLEGGTYEASIANFTKAIQLEPLNLIHYYEMALTYHERGESMDDSYAKAWLKKTISLTPHSEEDFETLKNANSLLKKISD